MQTKNKGKRNKKNLICFTLILAISLALLSSCSTPSSSTTPPTPLQEKLSLLEESMVTKETKKEIGKNPAGKAGYAVFFSVSNGEERARVYSGTGKSLEKAWNNAAENTEIGIEKAEIDPVWVKADIVRELEPRSVSLVESYLKDCTEYFFRYGIALDEGFESAYIESELNGTGSYDYDNGRIDLDVLNEYLAVSDRPVVEELPEEGYIFTCVSVFCDENGDVFELYPGGYRTGRRILDLVDADYVTGMISSASEYLAGEMQEDGLFPYGYTAYNMEPLDGYNEMRHAGTIWAMIRAYQICPSEELELAIRSGLEKMLGWIEYYDYDIAFILADGESKEYNVGANGLAMTAFLEYAETFGDDTYVEISKALGSGILMTQQENGSYRQILTADLSPGLSFVSEFYDGEANLGLCKLYKITGNTVWLDAVCNSVDYILMDEEYMQLAGHWTAYALNELTKILPDKEEYYRFALECMQSDLVSRRNSENTSATTMEMLMATFEIYDWAVENGIDVSWFDLDAFLSTISFRVNRMLDGYFFPELAMYMESPGDVLGAFMVRDSGFRIRIDDIQHNLGGLSLYVENYGKLVEYGMLEAEWVE